MRGIEPRVSATRKQRDTDSLHPGFGIIADLENERLDTQLFTVFFQPRGDLVNRKMVIIDSYGK